MKRFVDIDLHRLPAPDALSKLDYEQILRERMTEVARRLNDAGLAYDVQQLESDPVKILEEHSAYYEMYLRAAVNDAVKATHLAFAQGADLDQRAADLGVARQVLAPADPTTNPPTPAIMESDESLRRRRQLAIEAFSTAGPDGAYFFFALAAHPHVLDVAVYGPHSGLASDGEALIIVASNQGDGAPIPAVLDAIAEFLDARTVRYSSGSSRTRELTRRQKIRPLTDKVVVEAASVLSYQIDAVIKVPYGPDPDVVRSLAFQRVQAYAASRRRIGLMISDTAIAAALHVADQAGVAVVEDADVVITSAGVPVTDVLPGPKQIALLSALNLTVEIVQ